MSRTWQDHLLVGASIHQGWWRAFQKGVEVGTRELKRHRYIYFIGMQRPAALGCAIAALAVIAGAAKDVFKVPLSLNAVATRYPALFSSRLRDTWAVKDKSKGIEDTVLTVNSGRLPTGVPFPYFTPAANNVVLCFNHKMGAKRWKALLLNAFQEQQVSEADSSKVRAAWLPLDLQELRARLMDPAAVRIVFVRNPYVALLSAFLDVAGIDDATQANKHHISSRPGAIGRHLGVMGYNSTAQHFQRFLMDLIHLRATKQKVPGPMFVPQSSMCRIGQGMQYELALMVEAIDLWYPDLVNLLGLEEAARSGWCSNASQTANNALADGRAQCCFHRLQGMSCAETDRLLRAHGTPRYYAHIKAIMRQASSAMSPFLWTPPASSSTRADGMPGPISEADQEVRRFYSHEKNSELAARYIGQDLKLFGYSRIRPMEWP